MDLSRRLIGRCATLLPNGNDVEVDITGLVRRLVLFDMYILQSIRLEEVPQLLRAFGYEGLVALLKSDALRLHCDALSIGQIGRLDVPELRRKGKPLPLQHYRFAIVKRVDWQLHIEDRLRVLDPITILTTKQKDELREVIKSSLVTPPVDLGEFSLTQMQTELGGNAPIIKTTTAKALGDKLGTPVAPSDFRILIHRIDDEIFRAESNVANHFGLDELEAHQVIEHALLAVGLLNRRIEEMQAYNAISGFLPGDVPIFGEKLTFLAESLSPEAHLKRFQKVLEISGVPELDTVGDETRLDAGKLIEIRDSLECREFRSWLSNVESAPDAEIRERVASLRAKLAAFTHTKTGDNIRFLVTTGIGFIPGIGNVAGTALSFLDHFLVEKILPYSGPATFISVLYPSIFKTK